MGRMSATSPRRSLREVDRHGAAGHGAVQRHAWPTTSVTAAPRRQRRRTSCRPQPRWRRSAISSTALPQGYRHHGRRTWSQTVRRRKTAGGDCPHRSSKAPPILILDEATSALDSRHRTGHPGGAGLSSAAKPHHPGHRAPPVDCHRHADEIIVLKDGGIAERGTHGELIDRNGLYASMWNRQREATQAEETLKKVRESDDLGVVVRGPAAV